MKAYRASKLFRGTLQSESIGMDGNPAYLVDSAHRVIVKVHHTLTEEEINSMTLVWVESKKVYGSALDRLRIDNDFPTYGDMKLFLVITLVKFSSTEDETIHSIDELIKTSTKDQAKRGYSKVGRPRVGGKRLTVVMQDEDYDFLKEKSGDGNASKAMRGLIKKAK